MATETAVLSENAENANGKLRKKVFIARNSLLTDLCENGHFQSIKHICQTIFMCLLLGNIVQEYCGLGGNVSTFGVIKIVFGQFDRAVLIWLLMFASTLVIHPLLTLWAKFRPRKSGTFNFWDATWLSGLIVYYLLFLTVPPYFKGMQMPYASSGVVICEQIRLLMKTHAFIRSNVPDISSGKSVPEFGKYLYFLFAPTLLYRDTYPRTKIIRWSFLISHLLEFVCTVIFWSITSQVILSKYNSCQLSREAIVVLIFNNVPVAVLIVLTTFYFLFHCWMNCWAELTQFADRQFYEDWWTATSFSAFFRKWSGPVHDYLHEYIYRDFYEIIVPGNRTSAALAVFVISAVVHEYLTFFILGFCYPVIMLQFLTFGVAFNFLKTGEHQRYGNLFLWTMLVVGVSMQFVLFTIEYYARSNSPRTNFTFGDFFIPRSWSCIG